MGQRLIIVVLVTSLLCGAAGMWMGSALAASPADFIPDQTPQAICGGTGDMRLFFRTLGYTGDFRVVNAYREEALSRRYYHVKFAPDQIPALRKQLMTQWTQGRINRTVYENGALARVKRSRNMPGWWNFGDPPKADHLMFDHGGAANWYAVLTDSGEACFMWVGH